MKSPRATRSVARLLAPAAIASVVFAWLIVMAGQFSIVWDEGYSFERQESLGQWFGRLADPGPQGRSVLFSSEALRDSWRFSRAEPDGHGPFYCLLSLAGQTVFEPYLAPPLSRRIGNVALFAFACALLFSWMRDRHGPFVATVTIGMLSAAPRIVPEVCFSLVDGPLLSLSLIAFAMFIRAIENRSAWAMIAFGMAIGLAMATKLTGWLLPAPYIAWALIVRRREAFMTLVVGAFVAIVVALFLNVGWWQDPIAGIRGFFESNLSRRETIPVPTMYLDTQYDFSLPWHNTVVWTMVATPIVTLVLGVVGAVRSVARSKGDAIGLLLLLCWLLLMVVRAMPRAPGHDGTRQILIAFGFFTLLSGEGLGVLNHWASKQRGFISRVCVVGIAIAAVAEPVWANFAYRPCQLSYYSPLVGGLSGATALGFEPTYYWDSLTPEARSWLAENTPDGRAVLFRNWTPSWTYARRWGLLNVEVCQAPGDVERAKWFVWQNRPGMNDPADQWLIEHGNPAFRVKRFGVTLLAIYPIEQWRQARRETAGAPR